MDKQTLRKEQNSFLGKIDTLIKKKLEFNTNIFCIYKKKDNFKIQCPEKNQLRIKVENLVDAGNMKLFNKSNKYSIMLGSTHGVMAKLLDCSFDVSNFEHQSL